MTLVAAVFVAGCAGSGPVTLENTVVQLPNTGVRALSAPAYTPAQPVVVSISVVPNNGSSAYAIEDAPPAGWTVSSINEGGVFDANTGKVKWGVYFDQCPLYFTYTVTPPAGTAGTQAFLGTLSVDGVNSTVTGQTNLPHS
ncbi:MAG: hypothetical protein ACYC96_05875 [Fimbriimonadaceae bacterium]